MTKNSQFGKCYFLNKELDILYEEALEKGLQEALKLIKNDTKRNIKE